MKKIERALQPLGRESRTASKKSPPAARARGRSRGGQSVHFTEQVRDGEGNTWVGPESGTRDPEGREARAGRSVVRAHQQVGNVLLRCSAAWACGVTPRTAAEER